MKTIIALLALVAFPAWATSITITDSCPSYSINNANGVVSIACSSTPTPPPPTLPGDDVSCAGYTNTINLKFDYVPGRGQLSKTTSGMLSTDILVVRFTTPSSIAGGYGQNGLAGISHDYYSSPSNGFNGTFSTTPCTNTLATGWPSGATRSGLPGQSASWSFNTYKLAPNTTYYLNIKGDSPLTISLTAK